jgi:outer membrane protein OmpA-like peptidoglycan-associated protein
MSRSSLPKRLALSALGCASALACAGTARAQQTTFHLDRLEVPGAPDDGLVLFRPETRKGSLVYAQLGIGFSLNPLHAGTITTDSYALQHSPGNPITTQLSTYMSAGFQLLDRLTLGATFPIAWVETGNQQNIQSTGINTNAFTNYSTTGPAVGDMRLDARYVVWTSEDGRQAFGAQLGVRVPTGAGSTTNFGGDGGNLSALPMVTYEWTPPHFPTLVGNLGVDIRKSQAINDPTGAYGAANGLGVGTELRWALGAFLPIQGDKYRIGLSVFGQTGLVNDGITGPTFFTAENTPIEWNLEGRMRLPLQGLDNLYVGAGFGTLILDGYGAPDFRAAVFAGSYFPLEDTNPNSPAARLRVRTEIHQSLKDTDGDGIPDDIDACPTEPEDHKDPDPMDGCPAPSDRDGDGIPDQYDKCPDVPEDKDGIDDQDGCPEDDADQDGIPDVKDACPKEPGQPDPDPKKNGCPKFIKLEAGAVRVLQQVHFQTASATILPDSFPMLQEIVNLLKVNPTIKRMRIEGHTDNRGAAEMNLDLSKRRAASVRTWLEVHGIDPARLESEGYGLTKPIDTNDTDAGRAANRRVEFKITQEEGGGPPAK